jgi:hypothetical protein
MAHHSPAEAKPVMVLPNNTGRLLLTFPHGDDDDLETTTRTTLSFIQVKRIFLETGVREDFV